VGLIASPAITIEEGHLLSQIADHLGTANIDHRIGRRDVSDQDNDPIYPSLGCRIAEIETQDAILVAGSNIRSEAPIVAHRLRKAALAGASVNFLNSAEYEYFFDVANYVSGAGLVELLAGVAVAAAGRKALPDSIADICDGVNGVKASAAQRSIAASLRRADNALVLLGNIAGRHASYTAVRALSACIADMLGATLGGLSEGPNSAGAHLAGVLPNRTQGGENRESVGLDVASMLESKMDVVVLVNVEPDADIHATIDAVAKLASQKYVVALTPFVSDGLLECADLLLPTGTFAETSGTYVNIEGTWQTFSGVASPVGEARPTWKVLRVLGNLIEAPGFEYVTSEDVREEFAEQLGEVSTSNAYEGNGKVAKPNGEDSPAEEIDVPLYSSDGLVRRALALQLTDEARRAVAKGDET
jgi:NADH-quinone oxidoreductase subunit G